MNLRKFEEFVSAGIVKKQTLNRQRALSLIKEAEEKKNFLIISLKNIPKEQMNANFVVDYCYDILMELIRAKMFEDGYNAGNSHEAEVSYLENLGFPESDIRFMNEIRYYRNGTKYYGTILEKDYAEKVLGFMDKIYPKINAQLK
ncbi:MAG: hypothetical protein AABX63_04450 [Nanoarchaeota archaeon]